MGFYHHLAEGQAQAGAAGFLAAGGELLENSFLVFGQHDGIAGAHRSVVGDCGRHGRRPGHGDPIGDQPD